MGYSASLTYAVLLCAVLWEVHEVASQITEHPMNQTMPIGQNTTFRCNGTQQPVWVVNFASGVRYITDKARDIRLLKEMGISSQRRRDGGLILTVQATEANNNSNVTCRVFVNGGVNFSHVAKLTVLGPPSPPEPSLQILNATTLELTWPPPFSWPAYPIQNYTVRMVNTSNGRVTVRNVDMPQNDTVVTEYFSIPGGKVAMQCSLLQFAVTATSMLGESRARNMSEGFPIVPRSFNVNHDVSFRNDGTPQLSVEFTPPYVCRFQTADYTIEVQENGTNETFTQDPVRYSPATMREPVSLRVPAPLVVNREYVLTVTASTIAGSSSFISNFNTNFIPPLPTTTSTHPPSPPEISTSPPSTTDTPATDTPATDTPTTDTPTTIAATNINATPQGFNVLPVVGSVVGSLCGVLIICICALALALFCFIMYKKGIIGSSGASNNACTEEDYEVIDKYQPNSLPSKPSPYDFINDAPVNTSVSVIDLEETKIDLSAEGAKMEVQEGQGSSNTEDPYTVMNPAQVATVHEKNEHC